MNRHSKPQLKTIFICTLAILAALLAPGVGSVGANAAALTTAAYGAEELTASTMARITASNIEPGVALTAYRVADITFDYEVDQPVDPQYLWAGALDTNATASSTGISVATWVYLHYPSYIGSTTSGDATDVTTTEVTAAFAGESYEEGASATENETGISDAELAGFYDALAAAIRSGVVEVDADNGTYATTADEDGTAALTVAQGIYVVVTDNGVEYVHKVSSANVVPTWDDEADAWTLSDVEIEVKRSAISVEKTITNADDDGSESADAAGVGDTVSFQLVCAVPQYPRDALSYLYTISDEMSVGLTLDTSSIQVYGSQDAVLNLDAEAGDVDVELAAYEGSGSTAVVNYTPSTWVNSSTGLSAGFSLDFAYEQIDGYRYIIVTYDATVNAYAVTATASENEATLTWSNSPYLSTDSTTTSEDTVEVHTYGLDITKTNAAGDTLLAGATFTLADAQGNALSFVVNADGSYTLADTAVDGDVVDELVSDEEGSIEVHGLDTGTYTLVETVAPDGYNKIGYEVEVVITGSVDENTGLLDGGALLSGLYTNDVAEVDGRVNLTIVNTQGFELPQTGGMGTVVFMVAGLGLMALAVALLAKGRALKGKD